MPDTASLVLIKEFTYRGLPEEFSNKYHFTGTTPANAAAWTTLAQGWINEERKLFTSAVKFVRAYGYEPGSDHANFVIDYKVPPNTITSGSMSVAATQNIAPGDAAATVRWSTGAYNTRGKLIYCRKYFHQPTFMDGAPDDVAAAHLALYGAYAAVITSGAFPGAARYSGPQGAALSAPRVDPYITTRTLKRRGKRPLQ